MPVSYDKQQKDRDKEKYYLWEEKDLQPVSTQSNPRVAESKKLASPKFSPANLNLEKKKKKQKPHHSCFHWTLQAEIWENDVIRTYLLPAFVICPRISQRQQSQSKQSASL